MRALVIREGGELVVEERPDPVPGDGEVAIEVAAAGLNGADQLQRLGLYPAPAGTVQDVPGLELAGTVLSTGHGFSEGDRVMAVVPGGAQASRICVPAAEILPVPDGLSWAEAGGFPEVFTTAHDALVTQAKLASGDRLYVSGGAGGVGTAAVQLGVALGAKVIASVRNEAMRPAVAALGATAIDPAEAADHGPYDVVLELVGGPDLEAVVPALAPFARCVVIGVAAGAKASVNLLAIMGARATLTGSTLRARGAAEKAEVAARVREQVLPMLSSGQVAVPVEASFPLEEAAAAYERFSNGGKLGKVVLLP